MKKYKITAEYRERFSFEVEAKNEKEAEQIGQRQADEEVLMRLSCYGLDVKEVE